MRAGAWWSSGGGSSPRSAATTPAKMIVSAVAAGVHDARVAQRGEQLGAALDRVLAGVHGALERVGDRLVLLAAARSSGPSRGFSELCATSVTILCAISRATVRIVPSAGSRTEA